MVFVTFGCPSFPAFKRNDILGSQQRLKIAKIISIYGWPLCRKEGATKRDRDHHLDFLATYSGPAEGHKWFFWGGQLSIEERHLRNKDLLSSKPKFGWANGPPGPISVGPVSSWRHSRTETIERLFVCSSKHYSPRTSVMYYVLCSQSDESNKRGV